MARPFDDLQLRVRDQFRHERMSPHGNTLQVRVGTCQEGIISPVGLIDFLYQEHAGVVRFEEGYSFVDHFSGNDFFDGKARYHFTQAVDRIVH